MNESNQERPPESSNYHVAVKAEDNDEPATCLPTATISSVSLSSSKISTASTLSQNKWSSLPNMPYPRYRFAATSHGGRIYVFGGTYLDGQPKISNNVDMYDPTTRSWVELPKLSIPRTGCSCVVVGEDIYVLGGRTPYAKKCDGVEIFNLRKQTWSQLDSVMLWRRTYHSSVLVGTKIHVFGGTNSGSTEVYDIETKKWKETSPMKLARDAMGSAVIGNEIFAIGGKRTAMGHQTEVSEEMEVYDIAKDEWRISPERMKNRRYGCFAFATGSTITVIGGIVDGSQVHSVETYHTKESKWKGSVIHPLVSERKDYVGTIMGDSDLVLLGGGDKRGRASMSNVVEMYHGAISLISRAENEQITIPLMNESTNIQTTKKKKKKSRKRKRAQQLVSSPVLFEPRNLTRRSKVSNKNFEFKSQKILKKFDEGLFTGEIKSYDEKNRWWKVEYEDGDSEELNRNQIMHGLKLYQESMENDDQVILPIAEIPTKDDQHEDDSFPQMMPRRDFASIVHLGRIYIFGGSVGQKLSKSAEFLDEDKKVWVKLPNMIEKRTCCSCAAVGDNIYVIGGYLGQSSCTNSVEVFNIKKKKWKKFQHPMRHSRANHGSIAIGSRIYVFGGRYDTYDRSECFDTESKEWVSISGMNRNRNSFASIALGGKIFVIGGKVPPFCGQRVSKWPPSKRILDTVEIYDIETDQWTLSDNKLEDNRCFCSAVAVGSTIAVIGGIGGKNQESMMRSIELLQCNNNRTMKGFKIGEISIKRARFAAVLYQEKDLLVLGGNETARRTKAVEKSVVVSNFSNLVKENLVSISNRKRIFGTGRKQKRNQSLTSDTDDCDSQIVCQSKSNEQIRKPSLPSYLRTRIRSNRSLSSNSEPPNESDSESHTSEEKNQSSLNQSIPETRQEAIPPTRQDNRMQTIEEILDSRLNKVADLEVKAFGESSREGGLEGRIKKLEDFLGIRITF